MFARKQLKPISIPKRTQNSILLKTTASTNSGNSTKVQIKIKKPIVLRLRNKYNISKLECPMRLNEKISPIHNKKSCFVDAEDKEELKNLFLN